MTRPITLSPDYIVVCTEVLNLTYSTFAVDLITQRLKNEISRSSNYLYIITDSNGVKYKTVIASGTFNLLVPVKEEEATHAVTALWTAPSYITTENTTVAD